METTKNYLGINEQILAEWQEEFKRRGNNPDHFSYDGIMFKGEIHRECGTDDSNWVRDPSDDNYTVENKLWETAPLRILFLSKDQYIDDKAYESNILSFRDKTTVLEDFRLTSNRFLKRMAYAIYGLSKSTPNEVVPFDYPAEHEEEVLRWIDDFPFAWINCKKEGGGSTCSYSALVAAMNDYKDFLVKQIQNVDADIIVCCGYSENLSQSGQSTGYPILDFLKENVYDFEYAGNEYQDVWFDKKSGKLAIGSWHPSAWGKDITNESFYYYIVNTYQKFIHDNPSFVESHRKGL